MTELKTELVLDCCHELAEGPVWHEGLLWWVNINAGELHRLDPATLRHDARRIGGSLGCAVPCADGRWLLAHGGSLSFFDWISGALSPICEVERHLPRNRFNDGKCDPQGRFWIGSMNTDQSAATGALYVLEGGVAPRQVLTDRMISNGLAWSPDQRTLYHTDSWTRRIDAFDYDPETAALSAPKALVEFPSGVFPDGMAMDAEGNLWIALWGGGAVVRIDTRTGRELARIALPVSQPSSCAFGGSALDTLYITTAHEHFDASTRARQPLAGGIFCAHPRVCGLPMTLFTSQPDPAHLSFYPGSAERL